MRPVSRTSGLLLLLACGFGCQPDASAPVSGPRFSTSTLPLPPADPAIAFNPRWSGEALPETTPVVRVTITQPCA